MPMNTDDPGGSVDASPRERYLALDSLRGVCAVFVAFFHFQSIGWIHSSAFVRHSFMFVDFFFVLSGFVITASYGAKLASGFPAGRFMALRLGRLYPLHLAMLLVFLATAVLGPHLAPGLAVRAPFQAETSLAEFVYGLFFVQIFFGTQETWWNPPTWSIAAEIWTYLIAAVLFRASGRRVLPAALATAALAFVAYAVALRFDSSAHHLGALPRCLFSFALGIVAFVIFRRVRPGRIGSKGMNWTLLETAILLVAVLLVIGNYTLVGPLAFAVSVVIFAFQRGAWSRLLLTRPMLLLGTLSYSIYMVHFYVQARYLNVLGALGRLAGSGDFVARLHGQAPGGSRIVADLATLGMVAAVLPVAWCTYHLIERPGQRWSRHWILGRRTSRSEERAPTF